VRAYIPILFAAVTYFMMIPETVVGTPGDYVLQFLGISPRSGGFNARYNIHTGRHNTPYIFGMLFLISLLFVYLVSMKKHKLRKIEILSAFLIMMIAVNFSVTTSVQTFMKNEEGLKALSHEPREGRLEYEFVNDDLVEFDMNIELTNYSQEAKSFYVSFKNYYDNELGSNEIMVKTMDGQPALFTIEGDTSEVINITSKDYILDGWQYTGDHYKAISIQEFTLRDPEGQLIILSNESPWSEFVVK